MAHTTRLSHVRSWVFAARLAQLRGLRPDGETLAVSILLHDIGLARGGSPDRCFEVVGADFGKEFALAHRTGGNIREPGKCGSDDRYAGYIGVETVEESRTRIGYSSHVFSATLSILSAVPVKSEPANFSHVPRRYRV